MLRTGGTAIVSDEATLREAHALGRRMTGIDVCATGASGLAGLMTLQREETVDAASSALLIFSGVQR
jgi:threonine synthase